MFYWDDNVLDPNVHAAERRHARDLRRGHDAREGRRLHHAVDLQGSRSRASALRDGLRHLLPGPEPHPASRSIRSTIRTIPTRVQERLPAGIPELPGDGRLGAGRVPSGRHHRAAPQPLLLEGRRERAISCPISTRCSTGSRPGPTATSRPWPAPATSRTSSSRRATSRRCAAPPIPTRRRGSSSGRASSATRCCPNLSANGWGEPDERGQAIRELNRNLDFRKAVSYAIDRQRLGDSLVKGPFTAIYPGGPLRRHDLLRQGLARSTTRTRSRPRRRSSRRPG